MFFFSSFGNAINRSQIHYKIKILNSEKLKMNSYSFLYIYMKSTMLEFIFVKLPNVSHTKNSEENYHTAHIEIFHLKGLYSSHPFLHGVGQNPKAEK